MIIYYRDNICNKDIQKQYKNFLDIKNKLHECVSKSVKDKKVLYVTGNNDMILGDIGTEENEPYNTTDFYDLMESSFGVLPENERLVLISNEKPNEKYWGAFHYIVKGIDFIVFTKKYLLLRGYKNKS